MTYSTYVRPDEYKFWKLPETQFRPSGTDRYKDEWLLFDLNTNEYIRDTSQNSLIFSTYGKYAHNLVSLTNSLLNDRREEFDRENRRFNHDNG